MWVRARTLGEGSISITLLDNLTVVDHEVGKIYDLPLAGQRSRAVFAALILAAQAPLLRRDLAFAV